MINTPWKLTGETRYRHHWCWWGWVHFNLCLVLEVEEQRDQFRPVFTGHTPANRVAVRRWRPADTTDLTRLMIDFGKVFR